MRNTTESNSGHHQRATRPGPARLAATMAILIGVTAFAQDQGAERNPPEVLRQHEAVYLQAIRPGTVDNEPENAIGSGSVILYGQFIDPPYEFTTRDGALYLNGVRIDPPIVPPWKQQLKPLAATARDRQISLLSLRIRYTHAKLSARAEPEAAQVGVLEYIRTKERAVEEAEWAGPDMLEIVMTTGEQFAVMFRSPKRALERSARIRVPRDPTPQERYEASLRHGGLLVFGCGAILTVPSKYAATFLEQIRLGMRTSSADQIGEALRHPELVREMRFVHEGLSKEED